MSDAKGPERIWLSRASMRSAWLDVWFKWHDANFDEQDYIRADLVREIVNHLKHATTEVYRYNDSQTDEVVKEWKAAIAKIEEVLG